MVAITTTPILSHPQRLVLSLNLWRKMHLFEIKTRTWGLVLTLGNIVTAARLPKQFRYILNLIHIFSQNHINRSRGTSHITYFHFPDRKSKLIVSLQIVIAQVNRRTVKFVYPCHQSKRPLYEGWHKYILFIFSRPVLLWNLIDIINFKTLLFLDIFRNNFCYQS